jgi:hypothetical protein
MTPLCQGDSMAGSSQFPDGRSVTRGVGRVVNSADIHDFRLQDLRHTFASYQAIENAQERWFASATWDEGPACDHEFFASVEQIPHGCAERSQFRW